MVADSGGGSTELAIGTLTSAHELNIEFVRSIDMGARRLSDRSLSGEAPHSEDVLKAAHAEARAAFDAVYGAHGALADARFKQPERLIITGGTATTLVAVKKHLEPYDPKQVHLARISRPELDELEGRLAALSVDEIAHTVGVQPKRAHVLLGGTIVISELVSAASFDGFSVSESDLLFGLSLVAAGEFVGDAPCLSWRPELSLL